MSQIRNGFFGVLAVSLTLGAVQFASGHDLIGEQVAARAVPQNLINRAAKADRADSPAAAGVKMQTYGLRLDSVSNMSVLIRAPVAEQAPVRPVAPAALNRPGKTAVACEPVVSVLTEVAKLLQPGRCVT